MAPDSTVLLPARIVTGHDGTLGLTQAGTNISVSNDTDVEIPAEAVDGNLIARLVQHRGNVFYDVAPRDLGKLRVETPLLVAVIKGTQFNVAVQPDSTTISLFEGRLEIRTPDDTDVVQLNAGEIAIRSRTDGAIRVVGMDDDRVAAPRTAQPAGRRRRSDEQSAPRVVDLTNAIALASDGVAAGGSRAEVGLSAKPIVGAASGLEPAPTSAQRRHDGRLTSVGGANVALDTGIDLGGAARRRRWTPASTWAAARLTWGSTPASTWAAPRSMLGSMRAWISAAARSTSVSAPVSISAARASTSGSIRASILVAAPLT